MSGTTIATWFKRPIMGSSSLDNGCRKMPVDERDITGSEGVQKRHALQDASVLQILGQEIPGPGTPSRRPEHCVPKPQPVLPYDAHRIAKLSFPGRVDRQSRHPSLDELCCGRRLYLHLPRENVE